MKKSILFIILLSVCLSSQAQYDKSVKLETLLKTDTTSIGQKIVYPTFVTDEVSVVKVTIPPGKSTGWHKHVFPVFGYVLSGNLTVELETGTVSQYAANTSFSEVINTLHNGVNRGKEDVVLIAFFMGEKNKPLSVH